MSNIFDRTLRDGSRLSIYRFVFPEESDDLPDWLYPFMIHDLPSCWYVYYEQVLRKKHPNCRDFLYAGVLNGVPCSRMWFGYSLKTLSGNFGNVMTLPEFRRRGIMLELQRQCAEDFHQSGALFCSCDAADTAAPAYAAVGFRKIFGENTHPMAIMRKDVPCFSAILEKAYSNTERAVVRPAKFSDRFDCDKLLAYDPGIYGKVPRDPEFPDFLSQWVPLCERRAKINVLEAESGFCAGFAFQYSGRTSIVLHPRFRQYRDALAGETGAVPLHRNYAPHAHTSHGA